MPMAAVASDTDLATSDTDVLATRIFEICRSTHATLLPQTISKFLLVLSKAALFPWLPSLGAVCCPSFPGPHHAHSMPCPHHAHTTP